MRRRTTTWAVRWRRKAIFAARKTASAPRCGSIPDWPTRHGQLARLLGGALPEKDLIAQRRLLQQCSASGGQGGLAGTQRSFLHFGLAYVLDARASMPRPPNISIEATRSNGPSGAGTATSTTRKSTSFLSPARSPSARRISSRGFAVLGWRPRFPCSSWGYRDPAQRSSSKYWPAIQKSSVRVRLPWSATPWPRWLNQTRTSSSALADWTARRPSVLLRGTWSGFAQRVAERSASWTRRRRTTCIWVCWRVCFRGRN